MPIPFLQGATGDPFNFRRKIAPQATEDIAPAEADYQEFWSVGGPFAITPETIEPLGIATGAARPPRLIGKLGISNGPMALGDADPANKAALILKANVARKYTNTDLTLGRRRWQFSPLMSTAAAQWFAFLNDSDVLPRTRFINNIASSMRISAAPGENLAIEASVAPGEFDMNGVVTQFTGSGSTLPGVRGYNPDSIDELDATDKDIYLKIVNVTARTYQAKRSAAAAYGAATYVFTYDEWNRIWDETEAPVGTFAEQLKFYFPTAATLTNGDVFLIPKRRASFGAAFTGLRRVISSVSTAFLINGAERRIEGGWSAEFTCPDVERQQDTSGRQGARVARRGPIDVVVSIEREIVNLDLQAALLNATSLAVVMQCETQVVIPGGSLKPYREMILVPAGIPRGATFDVAVGGRGRTESIQIDAGEPSASLVYTPLGDAASPITVASHFAIVTENDVIALV